MTTRARKRAVPLTVVIVLALAAVAVAVVTDVRRQVSAGASSPPATTGAFPAPIPINVSRARPEVTVIGDSITFSAYGPLDRDLQAAGFAPSILAWPGHLFRDRLQSAADAAASLPPIVVINLGTNDHICLDENEKQPRGCTRYPDFTVGDLTADLDALLAIFPHDSTCVVAVSPTNAPEAAALWKDRLAAGQVDGIAGWGERSHDQPDLLLDKVGHLSDPGKDSYAEFVTAETERICGPRLVTI